MAKEPPTNAGHEQVRFLKRVMRPLPRRTNLQHYPILKWFRNAALKRDYLWSFREEHVIPAIYVGSVLSMLPVYGVQLATAFCLAIVLRANLMIFASLQFITNAFTVGPLYYAAYVLGKAVLANVGINLTGDVTATTESGEKLALVTDVLKATTVGGTLIGLMIGFVLAAFYRFFIRRFRMKHRLMHG